MKGDTVGARWPDLTFSTTETGVYIDTVVDSVIVQGQCIG